MVKIRYTLISIFLASPLACNLLSISRLTPQATPPSSPIQPTEIQSIPDTPTVLPSSTSVPTQLSSPTSPPPPTPAHIPINIAIVGSDSFSVQTRAALEFLAGCAPEALSNAQTLIRTIQESERSGMLTDEGTFLASQTTAFAPGYSPKAQIFWFAGTIIHDAHHRQQARNGVTMNWDAMSLTERRVIEQEARGVQIEVLLQCAGSLAETAKGETDHLLKYLIDMQTGVTPCDYCAVEWENRNW